MSKEGGTTQGLTFARRVSLAMRCIAVAVLMGSKTWPRVVVAQQQTLPPAAVRHEPVDGSRRVQASCTHPTQGQGRHHGQSQKKQPDETLTSRFGVGVLLQAGAKHVTKAIS